MTVHHYVSADRLRTLCSTHFDMAKLAARMVRMFPAEAAYWREKAYNDLDIAMGLRETARRRKIEETADVDLSLGREGLR